MQSSRQLHTLIYETVYTDQDGTLHTTVITVHTTDGSNLAARRERMEKIIDGCIKDSQTGVSKLLFNRMDLPTAVSDIAPGGRLLQAQPEPGSECQPRSLMIQVSNHNSPGELNVSPPNRTFDQSPSHA